MNYSAFHPRCACVSVLEHLPCQLLLSGFLKMYGCLLQLERQKHTLMLLKCNKMKNSVMWVTPAEGLDEGSMARILSKERKWKCSSYYVSGWREREGHRRQRKWGKSEMCVCACECERKTEIQTETQSLNKNRGPDTVCLYRAMVGKQPRGIK